MKKDIGTLSVIDPGAFLTFPGTNFYKPGVATDTLMWASVRLAPILSLDKGPFIAGGSIVRAMIGAPQVSDVDIFCCSSAQFAETIDYLQNIGATETPPDGPISMGPEDPGDKPDITVVNYLLTSPGGDIRLQLIDVEKRAVPGSTPQGVLLGFDIVAAMIATDGKNVLVHQYALVDILQQRVSVNQTSYREDLLKVRPHLGRNAIRVEKYKGLFGYYDVPLF